jgi:four helix bundle protein
MCVLSHAESFRDLLLYQKAKTLAQEIFAISRSFPKEETFSLTDQVRRSSRSVGALITEH